MLEYWTESTSPAVLHQEIARRVAEPRAKQQIVDALSRERLEFRSLWNSALAINRLPNELLIQIFKFVMVSSYPVSVFDVWPDGAMATPGRRFWWLMGVCRYWHEIIIGTPAFWCSVCLPQKSPFANWPWAELCLARSVAAPLDVIASTSYSRGVDAYLMTLRSLMHRIGTLSFTVSSIPDEPEPGVFASLLHFFGNGMPTLEGLHLVISHCARRPYHLPIDTELTCQRFPRLRHLALTGTVAPRDASFYAQLRTLSLTACSYNFSFDRFLDALASCTRLQVLHLKNVVDHLDGGYWMQRDPDLVSSAIRRPLISLPHLTKFVLSGHRAVCTARFLAHFYIHPSVCLAISAYAEDWDQDQDQHVNIPSLHRNGVRSVVTMLPSCYAVTLEPFAVARAVRMSMSHASVVEIETPGGSPGPGGVALRMRLAADHWHPPSRWGSVADLPRLLGRSPLTSLSVSYIVEDTVAAWAGVFRAFPLLERLYIEGHSSVGMVNAFFGLHAASADSTGADPDYLGPGLVACPNLAHVGVLGRGSAAVYEAIRMCVRYRGDRGAVLAELNIDLGEQCHLLDYAQYVAYVKDIRDCTERLMLRRPLCG